MNRIFNCLENDFFRVPDGTLVNPFLNPKDIMSGLPWDILDGLSVAAGQVNPGVVSEITVLPFISQVTVILSGSIRIVMKDPGTLDEPYSLDLKRPVPSGKPGFTTAAVLTPPGSFFQLDNSKGTEPAQVLYLTTPGYVFEPGSSTDSPPIYDDAVTVGSDWNNLAAQKWNPKELSDPKNSYSARQRAIQRLASQKRDSTSN